MMLTFKVVNITAARVLMFGVAIPKNVTTKTAAEAVSLIDQIGNSSACVAFPVA